MGKRIGLIVVALAVGSTVPKARSADIDTLSANIYSAALATPPTDATVAGDLASLQADGSFNTVDYTDTSTGNWQPPKHLNKLNEMAIAYATPSSTYYHSATVQAAIVNAYNYWVTKDYQNSNWFFNQISTPDKLGQAMILMQQNAMLPTSNFTKAISIVHRSATGQGGASQGANLASQAKCTVYEGVLRYRAPGASTTEKTNATNLIQTSYTYMGTTLATVTDLEVDGIRVDHSFQQHQQTLADAGYGASLLSSVATTSGWATGTSYGLSTTDVHRMVDYILDGGPQWMMRGTTYDPLAGGRGWTRTGTTDSASVLLGPVGSAKALSA
ncbi:MAG: cslA, partial [Phycisphaerales bacterium]|nr:cslA [Phycisphaerales bacterium]